MSLRVILDTNVVFEGLTRKGGASGLILDAWRSGLFTVCISDTIAYEYEDVLHRKLSKERWNNIRPLLLELLENQSEFVKIWFSWRPISPDPGDNHIIDCAMSARAMIVTSNTRDFQKAIKRLELNVLGPVPFLELLANQEPR